MKIENLLLQIANTTKSNEDVSVDYTPWVVAIATIALVLVTVYYASQTRNLVTIQEKSVEAMRESTIAQFRPHIQIDLVFKETDIPLIRIFNGGKGTAVKIEVKYKIKEIHSVENLHIISVLFHGNDKKIYVDPEGYSQKRYSNWYRENQTTLEIRWKCEDILKNVFESADEINVSQLISQRQNEYDI